MDLNLFKQAQERIKPFVRRTKLERSETLSQLLGANIFVKPELFQKTGSFKVRGAFNKLLSLSDDEKRRGVVAVSGGNHAQAVAYAATVLGIDAVILMPENTPLNYLAAARGYGATIELLPTIAAAFAELERFQAAGRVLVHPFDDPLVIAGQGTIGLEIVEDLSDVTGVFASIGGGGMAGGAAAAIKTLKPETRVWGVETEGADAMSQALQAGAPVTLPAITSIAKTLGAPAVSPATLNLARENFESVTIVSDREAMQALKLILERLKLLTEPATACTLAAAMRMKERFKPSDNIVLIFCGGNFSVDDLCRYNNL